MLVKICEYLCRLFVFALIDEVHGELHEGLAVSPAHTHNGLVNIYARCFKTAETELVHQTVVGALGVEVLSSHIFCSERGDTVDKSFLYEVVAEVHIVVLTDCKCYIDGACPVAVGNQFEHHKIAFVEGALAFE